jgi:hypothetical protein
MLVAGQNTCKISALTIIRQPNHADLSVGLPVHIALE